MQNKYQIGDIIKGKQTKFVYEITNVTFETYKNRFIYDLKPILGTHTSKYDVPEKDIDEHGELVNSYPNTGLTINNMNHATWQTGHTITLPTANEGKTYLIKNGNSPQTCNCDLRLLIQSGCQCGAITRYKPTYK